MRAAFLVLPILALMASYTCAAPIILEAEDYIASYNAGGASITVTSCSGASGGLAVEGYDYPGDWIELRVTLPESGAYADMFRSAGDDLVYSNHTAIIRVQGGNPVASSTYQTMGMGVG